VVLPQPLTLPEGPVRPVVVEGVGDRRFHRVPGVPLNPEFYNVPDRDAWIAALNADPEYSKLMKYLTSQELPSDLKERERLKGLRGFFFVEDGLLYYRHSTPEGKEVYLLEVPHAFRRDMIRLYHDHAMGGHRNADQIRKLILRNYRWAGLHRDCASYVKSCLMCFLAKGPNPRNQGLLCAAGADVGRFEGLHIDFVGPILDGTSRGNRFIFTMKDRGTGYLEAIPCRDSTAETAALVLWERWFMRFGIPKAIVSDQGAAESLLRHPLLVVQLRCLREGLQHVRDFLVPRADSQIVVQAQARETGISAVHEEERRISQSLLHSVVTHEHERRQFEIPGPDVSGTIRPHVRLKVPVFSFKQAVGLWMVGGGSAKLNVE